MRLSLHRNQVGDTIVEVLLAVGVVGLAVAGGYGIANRSLRQARQAQERGEAIKIAEGQVEAIKAYSANADDSTDLFNTDTKCIDLTDSDNIESFLFSDAGTGNDVPSDPQTDPLIDYPEPECVDGFYHAVIDATEDTSGPVVNRYEFTVTVRWPSLGGTDVEQVQMNYRTFVKKP